MAFSWLISCWESCSLFSLSLQVSNSGGCSRTLLLESLQYLENCFVGCSVICWQEPACSWGARASALQCYNYRHHHTHLAFYVGSGDQISGSGCVGEYLTTEPSPKPWSIFFTEVRGFFFFFKSCLLVVMIRAFMSFLFVTSTLKLLKEMC